MEFIMKIIRNVFLLSLLSLFSHSSFASPEMSSPKLEKCMSTECVNMFKQFKKYARHNMPIAMEALGNFYMHGYGVKQNFKKALRNYEHSARYGSATAQYKAGLMYILGMGTEENKIQKGITWLRFSFKNGNNDAAYYLAALYIKGEKVEKDLLIAKDWLEKSSKMGHGKSQFLLAQLYETGSFGSDQQSKAIALYSKSAFKSDGAKERLIALNVPLPEQVDTDIERIKVTPLSFIEAMELKIAGLKNMPAPGVTTGSMISSSFCRNAKYDCGNAGIKPYTAAMNSLLNSQ
jgi:TPR repeat protein